MVLGLAWDLFRVCEMFGSEYKSNRIRTSDSFSVWLSNTEFGGTTGSIIYFLLLWVGVTNLSVTKQTCTTLENGDLAKAWASQTKFLWMQLQKPFFWFICSHFENASVTLFFSSIIGFQHSIATNWAAVLFILNQIHKRFKKNDQNHHPRKLHPMINRIMLNYITNWQ